MWLVVGRFSCGQLPTYRWDSIGGGWVVVSGALVASQSMLAFLGHHPLSSQLGNRLRIWHLHTNILAFPGFTNPYKSW
jgi:hypothetical protein